MVGSRTVKVLVLLVVAMTAGTFVLMILERKSDPLAPEVERLAAVAAADELVAAVRTDRPLQKQKWQYIILHTSPTADTELARGCHFLVHPSKDAHGQFVQAALRWKQQLDGRHTFQAYNASSIGVCMIGDFSSRSPGDEQLGALTALVRLLQKNCQISGDRVIHASQLPAPARSAGP